MKKIIYFFYVKLFAHVRWVRLNRFIITLGLKGLGINNYETRKLSGEEYFIRWIKDNKFSDILFDVGANEGEYTQLCIDHGINQVYCFEPVKKTFDRLYLRYDTFENIECFNYGFSDTPSKEVIFDKNSSGSSHASLYQEAIADSMTIVSSEISLDTIDNFCKQKQISKIGLLKIDTEGHEYAVLIGAKEMLMRNSIEIIHFEFNKHNIFAGKFLKDYMELLSDFNLYRLLPNGFLPIQYDRPEMDEFFFFQNIIAIRKDIDKMQN